MTSSHVRLGIRFKSGTCHRQRQGESHVFAPSAVRRHLQRHSRQLLNTRTAAPGVRLTTPNLPESISGASCHGERADVTRKVNGGGWGGIRTPGEPRPTPVFKTGALNHSATHPCYVFNSLENRLPGTNHELAPIGPGSAGSPISRHPRHCRLNDASCCAVVALEEVAR
jgi:hypothetical protein